MVDEEIQTTVQWEPQGFDRLQLPKIKTEEDIVPESNPTRSKQQPRQIIPNNFEPSKPTFSRVLEASQQSGKPPTEDEPMQSRIVEGQSKPIAEVFVPDTNIPQFDIATYLQIYYPLSSILNNLRNN